KLLRTLLRHLALLLSRFLFGLFRGLLSPLRFGLLGGLFIRSLFHPFLGLLFHCRRRGSGWGWLWLILGVADPAESSGNQCKDKNSKRVLHSITSSPSLDASILQCFKLKKEKKKQSAMKKWSRLFKVWQKCVVTRSRIKDCRTGGHCLPEAFFEQ